jgi:UDP-N-acetylmuramoyl-tripeptide--D-alanyl-D-alanine ligase
MEISQLYKIYQQNPSVQTDTRKLQKDDLFFALKGPHFNGNLFAEKALEMGAAFAIIDEVPSVSNKRLILVENALDTLQQLAKFHRQQLNIPFIAITGSNGKTTSKELIYAVLSSHFKTYTTQGNLNNHIGVPLTILSVQPDAEMAVIEMGANHQKEIESYCSYTLPSHGLITNCGKAHLEGFGGVEGVRKGKGELFDFLRTHKGTAFVYADYDYLLPMSEGIEHKVFYGQSEGLIQGTVLWNNPFLKVAITKGLSTPTLASQLVGDYNLPNILCAAAIGKFFGVEDEKIATAIAAYSPSNSRSQLMQMGSNQIILDAYNANPTSMKAAIENFAKLDAPQKIIMLGAMMELGEESMAEHLALVELIREYTWKEVVLVGGDFKNIAHGFTYFEDALQAKSWLETQHFKDAYLLIKGSRSFKMERVIGQ